jgi:ferredoxin
VTTPRPRRGPRELGFRQLRPRDGGPRDGASRDPGIRPGSRPPLGGTRPERLHIDWTACDGRGLCTELLPELLDRDPWGFPRARDGAREPVVPPQLRPHAEKAVASCPLLALRLVT